MVIVETIDKDESTKYSIPISTSIRFCPLYDPNDNQDEARRGFMFETVGDMMSKKKLPKVYTMHEEVNPKPRRSHPSACLLRHAYIM